MCLCLQVRFRTLGLIVYYSPTDGAVDVGTGDVITIVFDSVMDESSVRTRALPLFVPSLYLPSLYLNASASFLPLCVHL